MGDTGLDELLAAVRDCSGAGSPPAEQLAAALREYQRAPVIQVAGRAGVGKSAVTVALGLPPTAEQPATTRKSPAPTGDLVIYVLPGAWDSTDTQAIAALTPASRLTVLNACNDQAGLALAETAAKDLAAQTLPMSCWLAAQVQHAGIDAADLRHFHALSATHRPLLTLSPDLFTAAPAPVSPDIRTALLTRWDFPGVTTILGALTAGPDLQPHALDQILYHVSGLAQLRVAVQQRTGQLQDLRGGKLIAALTAIACRAGGQARERIEAFLHGAAAAELSLAAGLADPALTTYTVAAQQHSGPTQLQYWSSLAGNSQVSPTVRRAALHIHHGYSRHPAAAEPGHA